MNHLTYAVAMACVLVTLAGCAHPDGRAPSIVPDGDEGFAAGRSASAVVSVAVPTPAEEAAAPAWSSAAFRFVTPPGQAPDWRLDHVVAGEIVAPIIARHGASLTHWRIHRRAAPDATGHQFTFFMYTSPAYATTVFDDLSALAVVDALARGGHLSQLVLLEGGPEGRPGVADTSDPNWSPELARAWPRFIEGVSDAWVALVREHTPPPPSAEGQSEESLDDTIARYGVGAEAVAAVWRDEGTHAFLHHVSAVFGYSPLLVRF